MCDVEHVLCMEPDLCIVAVAYDVVEQQIVDQEVMVGGVFSTIVLKLFKTINYTCRWSRFFLKCSHDRIKLIRICNIFKLNIF